MPRAHKVWPGGYRVDEDDEPTPYDDDELDELDSQEDSDRRFEAGAYGPVVEREREPSIESRIFPGIEEEIIWGRR